MQATESGARIVRDTAICLLTPEVLFALLANPSERQKWDLCPPWIVQQPFDAAPGLALEGARYGIRGTARGVPFTGTTRITHAARPHVYAYRSEMRFERSYPNGRTAEEYRIEQHGDGSLVHYTVMIFTDPGNSSLFMRLLSALLAPLTAASAAKRNFRNTIRYAEKYARASA